MNQEEINALAAVNQAKAHKVYEESGIPQIWRAAGCRVNLIGSLRMGLMFNHYDIDIHVYSKNITEAGTFAIAAKMSALPGVIDITGINGLHTPEHCMAWHVRYRSQDGDNWKFDIIHIEEGTMYDGFFENMADRIINIMTRDQHDTILRLKFETPEAEEIKGVEYYEAVIEGKVDTLDQLRQWLEAHRAKPAYYWIP